MDYTAWSKQHLKKLILYQAKKKVCVWVTPENDKPLAILVHGISGDHAGLIPLAAELVKTYRLVIVDLPGHGKSSMTPLPNASALQGWFAGVLGIITQKFGKPALVCAHSFGCSAVLDAEVLKNHRVILLNPVPMPSPIYETYARLIVRSAHFLAHIYNWRLFIWLRGITLAKLRTREVLRRVRWVGWNSRATYRQIVYQAGLVDLIVDTSAYEAAANGNVKLVVCGIGDTTARQRDSLDMETVFGKTRIVFLRGGHLLPIESPARVARLIREVMVH